MQEYFVDDLCELLLYVGQTAPKSLEALQLEEILVFMVVFMGSPGYVKNPFLRSRIAEVWVHACPLKPASKHTESMSHSQPTSHVHVLHISFSKTGRV